MTKEKRTITKIEDIPRIIDRLCEIYDESVAGLRSALARYLKNGERPDSMMRAEGGFSYPELRIDYPYGSTIMTSRSRSAVPRAKYPIPMS